MGDPPVGRAWPAHRYEVGREKIREYANAIGEGAPIHHDSAAARAAGFAGVVSPPLFAAVFCAPGLAAVIFDPEVGVFDPARGLAGYRFLQRKQRFRWGAPICSGDEIETVASLVGAGERDGRAYRTFETVSVNQDGHLVVRGTYEGVVPDGKPRKSASAAPAALEPATAPYGGATVGELRAGDRLPDLRYTPDRWSGCRYAGASGDFTPFHLDDSFARSQGMDGMILHGLYTLAVLVRACLSPFGGDPRVIAELSGGFRGVAYPERELRVSMAVEGVADGTAHLHSQVLQGDRVVIDAADVQLIEPERATGRTPKLR